MVCHKNALMKCLGGQTNCHVKKQMPTSEDTDLFPSLSFSMFMHLPLLDFITVSACLIFTLHPLQVETPKKQRLMRQNDKKLSEGCVSEWKYKRGASMQVVKIKIMHSTPTK